MPVLTFKGKTAVENYHHTVPHHLLEVVAGQSALAKGEKPSLEGNLTSARFGESVATAGDVNGDGYADVIVGAPSFSNGQAGEGRG